MTDARHERRSHFRGKSRPGRKLPVRWRVHDGAWIDSETRNVGTGGAFIAGTPVLTTGDKIELEITLPTTGRPLAMNAVVRWVMPTGDEPGFGLEFIEVEVDVLIELNDFFASLTGAEATST